MLVVSNRMKISFNLLIFTVLLCSVSASASFKCADRTYTLVLGQTTPGVPPKVTISPSLVHGGGTAVDTYQMKISYPHWKDATEVYSQYQQPGAFTGFVAIEGKGLQTIELLCTDTTKKGTENNSYISISNKVTWESKVGDFQDSLKNGDLIEQYPNSSGRALYKYENGKLSRINLGANQQEFYQANLNTFIRAPSQVITPIATGAVITQMFGYTTPTASTPVVEPVVEELSEPAITTPKEKPAIVNSTGTCSIKTKNDIDAKYKEAFKALRILHKKKNSKNNCEKI